jgi:hypothetical protein
MDYNEQLMTRYGTALALQGTADRSPLLAGDVEKPRVDFPLLLWQPSPAELERPH